MMTRPWRVFCGVIVLAVLIGAGIWWYRTWDYVNNGWREFRIACWHRSYEIDAPLTPEAVEIFSADLLKSYPGAVKVENGKIFIRPYIPLFDPQNYRKFSMNVVSKNLGVPSDAVYGNCLPYVRKFVTSFNGVMKYLPREEENEWLRKVIFFSPRFYFQRAELGKI